MYIKINITCNRVLHDTSNADYMEEICKDEIRAEIASSLQLKDGINKEY